jgi:hypothetical protein
VASGISSSHPKPIEALNANPVFDNLNNSYTGVEEPAPITGAMSHHTTITPPSEPVSPFKMPAEPIDALNMPLPSDPFGIPDQAVPDQKPDALNGPDGFAPPPVPPPIMPPFNTPSV